MPSKTEKSNGTICRLLNKTTEIRKKFVKVGKCYGVVNACFFDVCNCELTVKEEVIYLASEIR